MDNNKSETSLISRRSFLKGLLASLPIAAVASHAAKSEAYFTDTNKDGGYGNSHADATSINLQKMILDQCYPVGSIYWSMDSRNPHDIFGGGVPGNRSKTHLSLQ